MSPHLIRVRAVLVLTTSTVVLAALARALLAGLAAPGDDASAALVLTCSLGLLAALGWAWLTVFAGVVDGWRWAGSRADRQVPAARGLRRWVLAASGVALTSALSGALVGPAAHAAPAAPDVPPAPVQVPVRASVAAGQTSADQPVTMVRRPVAMTVRPGDCLWSIAASELQPGAGPATIAARWHAIYRTNRDVVGTDPDLIVPGQRLRLPR